MNKHLLGKMGNYHLFRSTLSDLMWEMHLASPSTSSHLKVCRVQSALVHSTEVQEAHQYEVRPYYHVHLSLKQFTALNGITGSGGYVVLQDVVAKVKSATASTSGPSTVAE